MIKHIIKFMSRMGYCIAFVSVVLLFLISGGSSLMGYIFLGSFAATCSIYAVEVILSEVPKIKNKGEK